MDKTNIVAFVYDITNKASFDNLKKWYKDKNDSIEVVGIIANKSDLNKNQIISKEEGENYSKNIDALFFETNAMDYKSVNEAFESLIKKKIEMEDEKKQKEEEEKVDELFFFLI